MEMWILVGWQYICRWSGIHFLLFFNKKMKQNANGKRERRERESKYTLHFAFGWTVLKILEFWPALLNVQWLYIIYMDETKVERNIAHQKKVERRRISKMENKNRSNRIVAFAKVCPLLFAWFVVISLSLYFCVSVSVFHLVIRLYLNDSISHDTIYFPFYTNNWF